MTDVTTPSKGEQVTATGPRRALFNSSRMSEARFAYLLTLPLLVVLVTVIIYPTLYSIWISFHEVDLIFDKWRPVGLGNYATALSNPDIYHSIFITVKYTLQVTLFSLIISVGAALLLNEKFKGRSLVTTIVILPWAVSTYATAVVWRFMYSPDWGLFDAVLLRLGIIDKPIVFLNQNTALTAVALAHTWQIAPLGIYFVLASLQVVPEDLYKAAKVDRLATLGRFRHVTFPYIRGPVLIILVLVTVEAARIFDVIFFMTGGGPGNASTTLTWEIYRQTFVNLNLGYGSAVSWLLVLLTIVITTIYFLLLSVRSRGVT